jgi:DUF4097 and DUF4098 domain-containing protein YvlB
MLALLALIPILSFQEECRFSAPREATVDVAAAEQIIIEAGAGSLRVIGRPSLSQVRVRGTACASDRDLLDEIQLTASRSGNAVRVKSLDDDLRLRGREYARLNVVIEVPESMAADINDGSGEIELSGLGEVVLDDGSGGIEARNLSGDVQIHDGSGEIRLTGVAGDVIIEDGSGEIELSDVQGSVEINDGSGEIVLSQIARNVTISDSSGDIDVDDVGGSLTVRNDSSGGVHYSAVKGAVRVPPDRAERRHRFR